jgi:succinate dehydrogenase / fumarate reductase flavoprotein subunit
MRTIETDVVVMGGGAAGTFAALKLEEAGIKPLIIAKGIIGKSGATVFAGNMILCGRTLDGTETEAAAVTDFFIRWYNHFLIDQEFVRKAEKWIEENYYPELEEIGLYFRRDDQGQIVKSHGVVRGIAARQQGQSGMLLIDRRRKQLRQRQIPTLEETAVTKILQGKNGEVLGVVAFHYPTGEIHVVRAKAVVVATGPSDRIAARATGTREQSGDGLALTYRAGGELLNLEIQWWHASDFKWPPTWQRMHVYPNPLVGTGDTARMYNSKDEVFFDQSVDAPLAYAPYPTQIKRVIQQVQAGKATLQGGYYTGYDHIDPTVLHLYARQLKAFAKVGLPPSKARVESQPSWHYRQGGINVDPHTLTTNIPGLLVAGAVGGHHNGSLAFVTHDGYQVAETLKEQRVGAKTLPELPQGQVNEEIVRISELLRAVPKNGITPMAVKKKIRDVMYEKMSVVKSKEGMERGLEEISRIRAEDAARMGLVNLTRQQNFGWLDSVDVYNLLDVCEVTIRSALNRTESRGPFYRIDYPYTDNKNWIKKNIVSRDGSGQIKFRHEPYEMPYIKPEFEREDYFHVDW